MLGMKGSAVGLALVDRAVFLVGKHLDGGVGKAFFAVRVVVEAAEVDMADLEVDIGGLEADTAVLEVDIAVLEADTAVLEVDTAVLVNTAALEAYKPKVEYRIFCQEADSPAVLVGFLLKSAVKLWPTEDTPVVGRSPVQAAMEEAAVYFGYSSFVHDRQIHSPPAARGSDCFCP